MKSFFNVVFLLTLIFSLTPVDANGETFQSQRRSPERALFGYFSGEDYLFGSSFGLAQNVRFTGDEGVAGEDSEKKKDTSTKQDTAEPARPAFVVKHTKPAEK